MRYDDGMGVLIIVSRIEHGDSISELLDGYEVPHEFLQGKLMETHEQKSYKR